MKIASSFRNGFFAILFTVGSANAGGIPTIDVAAISQNLQEYIGQVLEYAEQAERHVEDVTNWQMEYNSITGTRELGELIASTEKLQKKYRDMQKHYEDLERLVNDPLSAMESLTMDKLLNGEHKALNNCMGIVDQQTRNICLGDTATQILQRDEIIPTKKKELKELQEQVAGFSSNLSTSKDQKTSLDLLVAINIKLLQLETDKRAEEIAKEIKAANKELEKKRMEEHLLQEYIDRPYKLNIKSN